MRDWTTSATYLSNKRKKLTVIQQNWNEWKEHGHLILKEMHCDKIATTTNWSSTKDAHINTVILFFFVIISFRIIFKKCDYWLCSEPGQKHKDVTKCFKRRPLKV